MNLDLDTVIFDKGTTVRDLVESQLLAWPELKDEIRRTPIGGPDVPFECKFVLPIPVHLLKQVVREVIARGGERRPAANDAGIPFATVAEVGEDAQLSAQVVEAGLQPIDGTPFAALDFDAPHGPVQ